MLIKPKKRVIWLFRSTDFIFDGKQSSPYLENDTVNPLGSYGQSKWQGECSVQEILPDAIILRTAWVYGVHGNNFVKTMLRLILYLCFQRVIVLMLLKQ